MEKVFKENGKEIVVSNVDVSLANAIRRSINEIDVLAIKEIDVFRNDSAFSDEMLAHRIGLIPIENQKLKEGDVIEMKLKIESKENEFDVLSESLGDNVCIKDLPIIRLDKGQGVELIARASAGKGKEHARHIPGLVYYYEEKKITLKPEAKKVSELATKYPSVFEFDNELKVKNEWACNFDEEDVGIKGVEIKSTDSLVFVVEGWGMMECKEIVSESVKVLKKQLDDLKKAFK